MGCVRHADNPWQGRVVRSGFIHSQPTQSRISQTTGEGSWRGTGEAMDESALQQTLQHGRGASERVSRACSLKLGPSGVLGK
eukprot:1151867-Pleurochrysis_carterae.AAC.4